MYQISTFLNSRWFVVRTLNDKVMAKRLAGRWTRAMKKIGRNHTFVVRQILG